MNFLLPMEIPKDIAREAVLCDINPNSFDMCLVDTRIVFVKFKPNADKLMKDHALKLRAVSHVAKADPLVVSMKSGSQPLKDGVVYNRRNVPVLTPSTLKDYLEGESLPKAEKGGLKAEIDHDKLQSHTTSFPKAQLAKELGVSREMVRRYLTGESSPSLRITEKLVELFGGDILASSRDSYIHLPENELSSDFRRMGFEAEAPLEAPFDVIARGRELMLGIVEGHGFERRLQLLDKFSELLNAQVFIIGESGKDGIPLIKPQELNILGKKELLERIG
jgi:predicted transcriptional regulator